LRAGWPGRQADRGRRAGRRLAGQSAGEDDAVAVKAADVRKAYALAAIFLFVV